MPGVLVNALIKGSNLSFPKKSRTKLSRVETESYFTSAVNFAGIAHFPLFIHTVSISYIKYT